MKFFSFIILIYSFAFGTQAPDGYILSPVTDGYRSHYPNSLVFFDDESVRIVLNYNDTAGDFFEFFTVIENKRDTTILLQPLEIYAEMYSNEDSLTTEPEIQISADPDEQLEYINKEIADLTDENSLHSGLNCLFSSLSLAISVAERETPDPSLFDRSVEEEEYNYKISLLEEERTFWETEVMRETIIQPGKKAAGSFFIPLLPSARWVKLIIPIGDSEYIFNFRQNKEFFN